MEPAGSPILSLLEKITSRQISDLVFEQELLQQGYRLYYALDNHDVHRYCFPGNLTGTEFERKKDGTINYELETDRITAHDEFFSKVGKGHFCFFLDEYLSELMGLRDEMLRIIRTAELLNYADSFQSFLSKYTASDSGIKADFTLYIAMATGLLRNGAQRFNFLMDNPAFFIKPEDLDHEGLADARMIRAAFSETLDREDQLTDYIYQAFAQRSPRTARLSKKIDSEAIARMIRLNKYLLAEFPQSKTLFLFLSSADSTRDVFVGLDMQQRLPMVEQKPFNFHRTVEQLFIGRLLNDLPIEERLKRLETAGELVSYRERAQEITLENQVYHELETRALASFHRLREDYVNYNLARLEPFEETRKLQEKLDERFKGGGGRGVQTQQLRKMYSELKQVSQKYGTNEANREMIMKLESAFRISDVFTIVFKMAVSELEKDQRIQISRGQDPIKGAGQHLPIVFLCDISPHAKNLDDIAELYLSQFALADTSIQDRREVLLPDLRKLTSTIYQHDIDPSLGEKLVFCLYLLVLPDVTLFHPRTNNKIVRGFLAELFERELKTADSLLYSDYLYTYSWVLRRNAKYEEALMYAVQGVERYPDDARFYHARFLANACLHPEEHALHLRDISLAQQLYPELLKGKSPLIQRNVTAALLNSEIYASTLEIAHSLDAREKKLAALQRLRSEGLEKLKIEAGIMYEKYPEFLHTEAFLELNESENEGDKFRQLRKIEHALGAVHKGIEKARVLAGFDLGIFSTLGEELKQRRRALEGEG